MLFRTEPVMLEVGIKSALLTMHEHAILQLNTISV